MCGICGAFWSRSGRPVQRALLEQMCERIIHRGPDEDGFHVEDNFGVGMRRLSIIDLKGGSQPIFNEDRSVCTVQNGEIYNFRQLRANLEERGHRFRTSCDTEVIVHLYEEYGPDFVDHLNGMFAIAVWDAKRRRLVLVRDRLGQKPLYYAWTEDGLIFGSELKCLADSDEVPLDLNRQAVYHYFNLGYIPHPLSIYQDVHQLAPAERLIIEGEDIRRDTYWHIPTRVDPGIATEEATHRLRDLLADAVRLRMESDVPLGAFLSGGLDSSIIVALMAQQSATPVKTFHIDFAEPELSERSYARAVADRYGTDHHELLVEASAAGILDDLVKHFDEPFADASAIPTYYISQLTRQHVTVALAGDGGDESFGGYSRYRQILARRKMTPLVRGGIGGVGNAVHRLLPRTAPGRRYFRSLGMHPFRLFAVGTNELETRELLHPGFLEEMGETSTYDFIRHDIEKTDPHDPLAPYSSLDLHRYLPDDILTKVDRMSMAHSLELRAPLMDYRVVEYAATLPCRLKIRDGITKFVLKEAFRSELPDQILQQRKRGFSPPIQNWLKNELRPHLEEALHDREIEQAGIFCQSEMKAMAEEHFTGRRGRRSLLWRYLFFVRWWHHNHKRLACTR